MNVLSQIKFYLESSFLRITGNSYPFEMIDYEYNTPPKEIELINKRLPLEVLSKILSYLEGRDVQSAALSNKHWKDLSIEIIKIEEISKIGKLDKFLKEKLSLNEKKIQKKLDFIDKKRNQILNFKDLKSIKLSMEELREKFLNTLIYLKDVEKELKDLEHVFKSNKKIKINFFDNVFDLINVYKKLEEIKGEIFYEKEQSISDVCNILIDKKLFNQSIQFVHYFNEIIHFKNLFLELERRGYFHEALKAAKKMPNRSERGEFILLISKKFAQNGEINEALEITGGNPLIFQELLKEYNHEEVLKVANKISSRFIRERFLMYAFWEFTRQQGVDIHEVLKVANEVSDGYFKLDVLELSFKALMTQDKSDEALKVVNVMSESWTKLTSLDSICQAFIKKDKLDEALKVVNTMSDSMKSVCDRKMIYSRQIKYLRLICQALISKDKEEEALKVAYTLLEIKMADALFKYTLLGPLRKDNEPDEESKSKLRMTTFNLIVRECGFSNEFIKAKTILL